jgi:hypothetical protein
VPSENKALISPATIGFDTASTKDAEAATSKLLHELPNSL